MKQERKQKQPSSPVGIRLGRYYAFIGASLCLTLLVAGAIAYFLIIQSAARSAVQTRIDNQATLIAQSMQQSISHLQQAVDSVATAPQTTGLVTNSNETLTHEWEQNTLAMLPYAQSVDLITITEEQAQLEQLQTRLGFASYEMLHQILQDNAPPPEIHYIGTATPQIKVARPVYDETTITPIGALLVSFSLDYLQNAINRFDVSPAYVELTQFIDNNSTQMFIHEGNSGARTNTPSAQESIIVSNWQLDYWSPPTTAPLLQQNALAFSGALAATALFLCLLLYFFFRYFNTALRHDLGKITQFFANNPLTLPVQRYRLALFSQKLSTCSGNKSQTNQPNDHDTQGADLAFNPLFVQHNLLDTETDTPPALRAKNISPHIFRAYDIRGIIDESLDEAVVHDIGLAIGSEARSLGLSNIVVARDGRLSGLALLKALCEGLQATGLDVIDIGEVPTPTLYYAAHKLTQYSGVMVTGSHNPPQYNGLKIVLAGETLANDRIQMLYQRISTRSLQSGLGKITALAVEQEYIKAISTDVQIARPLKVVVDCGNGVAGKLAPLLYEALNCNVIPLYCEVNGHFPNHHPDPSVAENLAELIDKVKSSGADVGLAFDGDGDRLGVVTEKGEIIWPDRQMMLYAVDVLKNKPNSEIVFDVKCTNQLAKVIKQHGGKPTMYKTGHALIKEKLRETKAPLAGEMSGHIFFNDRWFGCDDALYAGARLLQILSFDDKIRTLDEIFSAFPNAINTPELKIAISEDRKFDFMRELQEKAQFQALNQVTIDGLRLEFEDGWGLIRPSNTTANLVLRFEAKDAPSLERIQHLFRDQIKATDDSLQLPF